ncbi:MAG: hypothetical protein ACI4LO_03495 [Anaerovoracaceae bacterium]
MKKIIVSAFTLAMLLSLGSASAFAADNCSYMTGQQRAQARNAAYEQASALGSEAEQKAFLNEQGIGETEWSEEAAASYSYVTGHQHGISYKASETDVSDTEDTSSYSYVTGRQRGSSYNH